MNTHGSAHRWVGMRIDRRPIRPSISCAGRIAPKGEGSWRGVPPQSIGLSSRGKTDRNEPRQRRWSGSGLVWLATVASRPTSLTGIPGNGSEGAIAPSPVAAPNDLRPIAGVGRDRDSMRGTMGSPQSFRLGAASRYSRRFGWHCTELGRWEGISSGRMLRILPVAGTAARSHSNDTAGGNGSASRTGRPDEVQPRRLGTRRIALNRAACRERNRSMRRSGSDAMPQPSEPGFPVFGKTLAAVYGSSLRWLEGNLALPSAIRTDRFMHLSGPEAPGASKTSVIHPITHADWNLQISVNESGINKYARAICRRWGQCVPITDCSIPLARRRSGRCPPEGRACTGTRIPSDIRAMDISSLK